MIIIINLCMRTASLFTAFNNCADNVFDYMINEISVAEICSFRTDIFST